MRELTGGDASRPIVTVGWNSERFDGRNLALRLVALGYQRVYWVRAEGAKRGRWLDCRRLRPRSRAGDRSSVAFGCPAGTSATIDRRFGFAAISDSEWIKSGAWYPRCRQASDRFRRFGRAQRQVLIADDDTTIGT